ncbi:MAG: 3-hydroxyanthranilate 3,4-dioxygenase [Phycisphaerales bacterium]|nr:3-hydroxyanthranilate 3,4-dioxygenase [Phycisphaerales bacterium]
MHMRKEQAMAAAVTSTVRSPINIQRWVQEHADQLKPPVSNKYLYRGKDFFVMVIGGPNARNDFHKTNSEEYFYQFKGDVCVSTIEDGKTVHHVIREGETFFIPPNVPHAPQRPPGTIGIVVERNRPAGETEHQQFYCPQCDALVWDEEFDCKDIVEHFAASMEAFWADKERSTCANCGTHIGKPAPVARLETEPVVRIVREGD